MTRIAFFPIRYTVDTTSAFAWCRDGRPATDGDAVRWENEGKVLRTDFVPRQDAANEHAAGGAVQLPGGIDSAETTWKRPIEPALGVLGKARLGHSDWSHRDWQMTVPRYIRLSLLVGFQQFPSLE